MPAQTQTPSFDPTQYGATPAQASQSSGGFDPTQFGATPVASSQPSPQSQQPPQSLGDQVWSALAGGATNVTNALGLGGAVNTLGQNAAVIGNAFDPTASLQQKVKNSQYLQPASMEQNVGAGLQLGAAGAGLAAAPESVAGMAGAGAVLGGAQAGGASMGANESLPTVAQKTATGAGVGAAVAGAVGGAGKLLGSLGDKIMTSVIKPSKADIADGFNLQTIKDFNLGGSLNQTYNKTQSALNDLTNQLNEKLGNTETNVNLQNVFQKTSADMGGQGSSLKTFGFNSKIGGALQQLQDEVLSVGGNISVPEAQIVKQSAGKLGAWAFGKPDPESSATEAVYNTFYNNLKTEIEKSSPDGIKEINQQLGKLIPVQNALIRRMPVAERNAALSLTDIISMSAGTTHPSSFGLTLLNRFAKSGTAGNLLSKYVSGALQGISPTVGEAVGGATSQNQSSGQGAAPTPTSGL